MARWLPSNSKRDRSKNSYDLITTILRKSSVQQSGAVVRLLVLPQPLPLPAAPIWSVIRARDCGQGRTVQA